MIKKFSIIFIGLLFFTGSVVAQGECAYCTFRPVTPEIIADCELSCQDLGYPEVVRWSVIQSNEWGYDVAEATLYCCPSSPNTFPGGAPANLCNLPNKCTEVGKACTVFGAGWTAISGQCPQMGQSCCALSPTPSPGGTIGSSVTIQNPLAYNNIEDLINKVIEFLIKIGAPIAGVMFVIAGIMFVTSAGDPEKVRTARKVMIYTAVGFAVILVASGLIKVVQSLLGGP